MKISLQWLNRHLDRPTDADEIEHVLTDQGFPIEAREPAGDGDTMLDVEITSNRGDCLSHVGVARELAAGTGRGLVQPDTTLPDDPADPSRPAVESLASVTNEALDACPLYTARVIRHVKVGPSPAWLVQSLEALGLRSVNNIVDVTNYVLMELGQPLHAFDLNKLAGRRIVVRPATAGEVFEAIDGSRHTLKAGMLVIADEARPAAIAGVMGGAASEVTHATTDILLESAIFSPMSVRQTSRSLKLMSDSSHRFERGVDPQGVDRASQRAARLILELAGGELALGVLTAGELPAGQSRPVSLRVQRCVDLLGLELSALRMVEILDRLGLSPRLDQEGQVITCTIPSYRLDLTREVDLIEEVARLAGLDGIPVHDRIHIQARAPQPHVVARQTLDQTLTAHGCFETINFSFLSVAQGRPFVPAGHEPLLIDDDRRKTEPLLRPSLLPSLLVCRKANQDAGNHEVRLYEVASTWTRAAGQTLEKRRLGLLIDAPAPQAALRQVRGILDEVVQMLTGDDAITIEADSSPQADLYQVAGKLIFRGQMVGHFGVASAGLLGLFGLQAGVVLAELDIEPLLKAYPPRHTVSPLARFPGTWRDLSIIVEEATPWSAIEAQIHQAQLPMLETLEFLTTYRGKPIEPGHKSVSFRMFFRDPQGTLRHEQVDPQITTLVERLKAALGATLRQ